MQRCSWRPSLLFWVRLADSRGTANGLMCYYPYERQDYGEKRYATAGWLRGSFMMLVWTPRDGGHRIISMRYGHEQEEKRYREQMD
ncbi:MAG TPA: BrnT family toxin [Alphaproteobacteria bacterium]|nr:BrnT family toxin [Alphaproteobacteria bacterium]